jgi:hypothetical protein
MQMQPRKGEDSLLLYVMLAFIAMTVAVLALSLYG